MIENEIHGHVGSEMTIGTRRVIIPVPGRLTRTILTAHMIYLHDGHNKEVAHPSLYHSHHAVPQTIVFGRSPFLVRRLNEAVSALV